MDVTWTIQPKPAGHQCMNFCLPLLPQAVLMFAQQQIGASGTQQNDFTVKKA